jgi:hypothetical protein
MEAKLSSEMLATTYKTTRCHKTEDHNRHLHCRENLKSHIVTNKNYYLEEIKSRLNSRNACHHAVQNLLSPRIITTNVKIKILLKSTIFSVILYGCETRFLALTEEHRLRVIENEVLWRILVPKLKWQDAGENYIMRCFIIGTPRQIG